MDDQFKVKIGKVKKKPDMTDDWMDPTTSLFRSYTIGCPRNEMEYLIERERRELCFGNIPGFITRWDCWDKFKTKSERDEAIKKLSEEHPMWHLRARDHNPYWVLAKFKVKS